MEAFWNSAHCSRLTGSADATDTACTRKRWLFWPSLPCGWRMTCTSCVSFAFNVPELGRTRYAFGAVVFTLKATFPEWALVSLSIVLGDEVWDVLQKWSVLS